MRKKNKREKKALKVTNQSLSTIRVEKKKDVVAFPTTYLNIMLSILFIICFNKKLKRKIRAKNKDYTTRRGTQALKKGHAWPFFFFFFEFKV